jgi:DNA-binding transcriptional LysR family regulator
MFDWAELRHFRYLLAILERQGFRPAAEELHTSQPNLSVQARQFQDNASVRLYKKLKNGRIRPTETGVAFIALARMLLETRDEVIHALIAIERGQIGSVRFGCAPLVDQNLFRSFCAIHKEILPACSIRPTHGDTAQLAEEVLAGVVDAAIVTLPLKHPDLRIEEIRQDRLVVCLRRDNPLANRAALQATDLQENLAVLYHPQRHPDAHERLLELLAEEGVKIEEYSRASNPFEMQMLVKEGHGFTLIREGSALDEELTTCPIEGVASRIACRSQRYRFQFVVSWRRLLQAVETGMQAAAQSDAHGSKLHPFPAARPRRRDRSTAGARLPQTAFQIVVKLSSGRRRGSPTCFFTDRP